MTYYEELGISADAAEEDIRQAHRRLVKLLHPDQQTNGELRRMAELQLTRVNTLVEQLLDPTQRRLYDVALRAPLPHASVGQHAVPRDVPHETMQRGWKYALAGVALATVAWIFAASTPTDVVRSVTAGVMSGRVPAAGSEVAPLPPKTAKASTPVPIPQSIPVSVPPLAGMPNAKEVWPSEAHPVAVEAATAVAVAQAHANPETPPPAQQPVESRPTSAGPAQSAAPTLAGVWLYAGGKRATEEDEKLYKPEYIELRISEDPAGVLHGEYRSRYAVTDRPISPAVNFSFHANPATAAALPWKGPKGSSGTIVLKLLHRNAMQVDWQVEEAGDSGIGLEFGTAILIRRL